MLKARSTIMIAQTLLYGFLLFTAALAKKTKEDTPRVFNIKVALEKFVGIFEKVYKVKVEWTDMKSEREEVKTLFATRKFYLKGDMDRIKMGKPKQRHTVRTLLYANLYENKANKNQTYTVTHSTIRKEKTSTTVKKGFSLGLEVSGGVGFKEVYGLSFTVGTKFDRETVSTDTVTKLKKFEVATAVNVLPNKTVEVRWYANTATTDIPWTCNMTISGYFAMKTVRPLQGTSLLIIPATYLALANKELKVVGPRHVRFEMSGVFTKVNMPESDIYTNDVTDSEKGKIMQTL